MGETRVEGGKEGWMRWTTWTLLTKGMMKGSSDNTISFLTSLFDSCGAFSLTAEEGGLREDGVNGARKV